jgi:hypothetical protein
MKIIRKQKPYKKYVIASIAVLSVIILAAALYVYAFGGEILGWKATRSDSTINLDAPTKEQAEAAQDTKRIATESDSGETKGSTSGSDPLPPPSPSEDGKSTVSMAITASSQNDQVYQLRTMIYALANEGTCSLVLTSTSGKTVTKSVSVQPMSNTTACKGFDIPLADLSAGNWKVHVSFENTKLIGSADSTITVK